MHLALRTSVKIDPERMIKKIKMPTQHSLSLTKFAFTGIQLTHNSQDVPQGGAHGNQELL